MRPLPDQWCGIGTLKALDLDKQGDGHAKCHGDDQQEEGVMPGTTWFARHRMGSQ